MDDHVFIGDALEHDLPLHFGDWFVRAEGGHNIDLHALCGQQLIVNARNLARLRVKAREIRRDDEHLFERSSFQRFLKRFF